jgi:site-specific DNA recombinase
MDHFSRNLGETHMKIKELNDKYGIKVIATIDNINTDFFGASTFMMQAFKLMMAESELHRIRKRTRDGYNEA